MAWRFVLLAICCLAGCDAQGLREELLDIARQRITVFFADKGNLQDQKSQSGVDFSLSKDTKACGDNGIPLVFLEFDIALDGDAEVRPVDAFNVLTDVLGQPKWDAHNSKATALGDFQEQQARGYSAVFTVKPLGDRELYEWQVAAANFTTQEFWLVYSSLDTDSLLQVQPREPGSVAMLNCLGAMYMTKTPTGVHVIKTDQPNSNVGLLDPRTIENVGWAANVDWVQALRTQVQDQAKLRWAANKTLLPRWMLEDRPCGAQALNTDLKKEYLAHAHQRLQTPEADRGKKSSLKLDDGSTLQVWQGSGGCAVGHGSPQEMPLWQASFNVPKANPAEVFNVLVHKADEVRWDSDLKQVNLTGFSHGARGLHEEYKFPWPLEDRELWEWQAAGHNLTNESESGTYLVAISSATSPFTQPFRKEDVEAAQCMAAYQVSPNPDGGSIVNMTTHLNPQILWASTLSKMWPKIGEDQLVKFANELTKTSQQQSSLRSSGTKVEVDGQALQLLAPTPPGRNDSATLLSVIQASNSSRLRVFSSLDVPRLLDTSEWPASDFQKYAEELLQVYNLLKANATAEEATTFRRGLALDPLAVQLQGQALASMQWRVLQQIAQQDCVAAHLPDINNNKGAHGLSLVLIGVCGAAVVLLCGACVTFSCVFWKRRRRDRRAHAAAAALLDRAPSLPAPVPQPPSQRDVVPES